MGADGISMDSDWVATIQDWLMLESFHNIQVFLGFTGFFHQFIENYTKITAPLTDLLQGMEQEKKKGPFCLMMEGHQACECLKQEFMEPPVLKHFDYCLPTLVVTDVSWYAVVAILLQPEDDLSVELWACDWHPVVYYSQKLHDVEH